MFLSAEYLADLRIQQSVFHIVTRAKLDLLSEFSERKHDPFFHARVKASAKGNRYRFDPASATRARLHRILASPSSFQAESEELARSFHGLHQGTTGAAPGAFLILSMIPKGGPRVFALLKFDNSEVLSYGLTGSKSGGRPIPTLMNIQNSFVESRDALQKAALVRLDTDDVLVVDRRSSPNPAHYFLNFLGVRRHRTPDELARALGRLTVEFVEDYETQLDPDIVAHVHQRLYDAAEQETAIDGQAPEAWINAVVGPLPPQLMAKFKQMMERDHLDGEDFGMTPGSVRKPTMRRLVTVNGVSVRFPPEKEGSVVNLDRDDSGVITSIHVTDEVRRDFLENPDRSGV